VSRRAICVRAKAGGDHAAHLLARQQRIARVKPSRDVEGDEVHPAACRVDHQAAAHGEQGAAIIARARRDTIGDVTAEKLKALRDELIDAGLSLQGGVSGRMRVLRNFLRWARRNGYDSDADAGNVHPPQVKWEDIEPTTLTKTQERALYQAARSDRDRLLVRFLLNTGLRVSEVEGLTLASIEDVDLADGTTERVLRVLQGKGRKDRHVPLNTRAEPRFDREIADYVRTVRPKAARSRALFLIPSERGAEPDTYRLLSTAGIKTLFARLRLDTGIPIHPHVCRHTMASRWISSGVPPSVVKRALGHSSMRMVERYVHFDAADLAAAARG
jgi:site-specific recombinase XerD